MKRSYNLIAFIMLVAGLASAQTKIPAKEASKHLNETVMVCDKVYGTKFFDESGLTLLDLGGNHPNQCLTVVINKEDRSKFKDKPEDYFKGANVCVTGKIIDYHGKPEIAVTDPKDLKIDMTDDTVKRKQKAGN
jgi:DNA/RNA endonuclease YhcR with UshA esterase domain